MRARNKLLAFCLCLLLAACGGGATDLAPRPTRVLSGPTLAPSPTVAIRPSGELFASVTPPGANNPASALLPSGQYQPPLISPPQRLGDARTLLLTLSSGEMLDASLHESSPGVRGPTLLLLGPQRDNWGELPLRLADRGYTVVVTALPRFDYPAAEIQTLLETVAQLPTADPSKMAILAELEASDWAMEGCGLTGLCKAVIALSPTHRARAEVSAAQLGDRPLLVAAALDDIQSYPAALAIAEVLPSMQFAQATTGRGAALFLLEETLELQLMGFLDAAFAR